MIAGDDVVGIIGKEMGSSGPNLSAYIFHGEHRYHPLTTFGNRYSDDPP